MASQVSVTVLALAPLAPCGAGGGPRLYNNSSIAPLPHSRNLAEAEGLGAALGQLLALRVELLLGAPPRGRPGRPRRDHRPGRGLLLRRGPVHVGGVGVAVAAEEGEPDVGLLEGPHVVPAVAAHEHVVLRVVALEAADDLGLALGGAPSEDAHRVHLNSSQEDVMCRLAGIMSWGVGKEGRGRRWGGGLVCAAACFDRGGVRFCRSFEAGRQRGVDAAPRFPAGVTGELD